MRQQHCGAGPLRDNLQRPAQYLLQFVDLFTALARHHPLKTVA